MLRQRLRNLAPNHASAVPRDAPAGRADNGSADGARGDDRIRGDRTGLRGDDTLGQSFWDRVDHLRSLWAAHQQRWPRSAARDRSRADDPAGSWRGPGDRTLSADENTQADQVIGLLQECEKTVTARLEELQSQSPFGARLVGLEHRCKGPDRLKEKIAVGLQVEDVTGVAEATVSIFDAVRYTFCLGVEDYAEGYADMHERLESAGYRMIFRANRWTGDPEYRGMNTRWVTPEGDRFELQFHTSESFFAKESLTHDAYERIRDQKTTKSELDELRTYQREVCAAVPAPDGIGDILDVRPR